MICNLCHERPATFHLTEIHEGERREAHLCEVCARKHAALMSRPTASIADLIAGAEADTATEPESAEEALPVTEADTACPECGITFKEFQATGRFGCPNDYLVFAEELAQLVRRAHGTTRHIGRTPPGTGRAELLTRELEIVRTELKRHVADEAYEKAAAARDRIARLEASLRTEGAAS